MNKKLLLIPALAASLFAAPLHSNAAPAAAQLTTRLTFNNAFMGNPVFVADVLVRKGVSYIPSYITTTAGLQSEWKEGDQRASFVGWEKSFAVRVGSRAGMLDGKPADLGGAPFVHEKQLYLPLKFTVKALEGSTLQLDLKKRLISAGNLKTFDMYAQKFDGSLYAVSKQTGDLVVTDAKGNKSKVANLGKWLDYVDFTFQRTPGGLLVMRVSNITGEPHIFIDWITLVMKHGNVIRQSSAGFHTTFNEPPIWSGHQLLLSDGKLLRVIEDSSGDVSATYNLDELMGADKSDSESMTYNVEAFEDDFALVRPRKSGVLTLVMRATGEKVELYKGLLDAEDLKIAESNINDPMFPGDRLKYSGRSGNKLTFTTGSADEIKKYTYTLPAVLP
jgi:hypothetical protein